MPQYKPDKFAIYFNSNKIWQELWEFLIQKETIIRMQTASDLNRPALEGILELLEDKFGRYYLKKKSNKAEFDKLKQMTGHMIKQVMHEVSKPKYPWVKYNVRLKQYYDNDMPNIFVRASLYRKLDRIDD